MSGLVRFEDKAAIFAPQYFGSIGYYALMGAFKKVYIDSTMRADKRMKSTHRCRIVDTRDELFLTVPVSHPHGPHSWKDTIVSTHGEWWNVHLTALESAYGRTPFFEFYIDKFKSFFEASRYNGNAAEYVFFLDAEIDAVIRGILGFENDVKVIEYDVETNSYHDLRKFDFDIIKPIEYYQVRADRLGFRGGLSILDLIFNLGPESPLILKKMVDCSSSLDL